MMRYRFASPEWLAAIHGIFAQRASALRAQGIADRVSICEVYRNCPADLGWTNNELAWSCVYEDGVVDFRRTERSDVSFKVSGTYAALAPLVTFEIGTDPARAATFGQMVMDCLASGGITPEIGEGFAEPGDLESFHDVLARISSIDAVNGPSAP